MSKSEQLRSGPAGSYLVSKATTVAVGVSVGAGTGVSVGCGTGVEVGCGAAVGAAVGTATATWAGCVGAAAGAGADTGAVLVSARSLSTLAHSSTSPPPNPARYAMTPSPAMAILLDCLRIRRSAMALPTGKAMS